MRDQTLLRIGIFGSVIGLIILYIGTLAIEPTQLEIQEIDETYIGKLVQVQGQIETIREFESSFLLQIDGISVFSLKTLTPEVKKGDWVQITGQVKEYKESLEIIPRIPGDLVVL